MINQFIIYGERHSGTKFLQKLINDNLHIVYAKGFNHKHFFTPEFILRQSQITIKSTIFFCIVRNPYDWIMSFHRERHHCGINAANNIYNFMSKPWISREPFLGPEIMLDRHLYNKKPYPTIFHMRSAKNQFLYSILPRYVEHHLFVRYEDFLEEKYLDFFLHHIGTVFDIKIKHNKSVTNFDNKRYYYNLIDDKLLAYINHHTDWNIENSIGYKMAHSLSDLKNKNS